MEKSPNARLFHQMVWLTLRAARVRMFTGKIRRGNTDRMFLEEAPNTPIPAPRGKYKPDGKTVRLLLFSGCAGLLCLYGLESCISLHQRGRLKNFAQTDNQSFFCLLFFSKKSRIQNQKKEQETAPLMKNINFYQTND